MSRTASNPTAKQLIALAGRITQTLGTMEFDLDRERVKWWLSGGGTELKNKIRDMLIWDQYQALASWDAFYKIFFGRESLMTAPGCRPWFKIPDFLPGFDRLIVVDQGLTLEQVIYICRQYFPVSVNLMRIEGEYEKWLASLSHDRGTSKRYAIVVRDSGEADPDLAKKSAEQLAREKIPGMTLLEYLLFALKYYTETGYHLDDMYVFPDNSHDFSMPGPGRYNTRTLITGTRDSRRYWSAGWRDCTHLFIDSEFPDSRHFELRSRRVICVN